MWVGCVCVKTRVRERGRIKPISKDDGQWLESDFVL